MASKIAKVVSHFKRHPRDLFFFLGQIIFGYCHSFIKLWALITFWNVGWGSRDLTDAEADGDEFLEEKVDVGDDVSFENYDVKVRR